MQGKTFISYTRTDSAFARRLSNDLRAAKIDVWLDQDDIRPGEPWDETVERALRVSAAVLVILTPEAVASGSVLNEISYALATKKRVVPVLVRPCILPLLINRLQYTDFQNNYAAALARVIASLSSDGKGADPLPPPPPPPPKFVYLAMAIAFLRSLFIAWRHSLLSRSLLTACRRLLILLVLAVASGCILAVTAYWLFAREPPVEWGKVPYNDPLLADCKGDPQCVSRKALAASLREIKDKDWEAQVVDSRLFRDCMSYPPCGKRKAHAAKLHAVTDWKAQPIDSPLLRDCMSFQLCDVRSKWAETLRGVPAWDHVAFNSPLLSDCMNFGPCLAAVAEVREIKPLDFTKITVSDPRRSHCHEWQPCLKEFPPPPPPPPPPPVQIPVVHKKADEDKGGGDAVLKYDDCCANMGKRAPECRAWKARQGVRDHCVGK
jgi:TIR domain-containing protein